MVNISKSIQLLWGLFLLKKKDTADLNSDYLCFHNASYKYMDNGLEEHNIATFYFQQRSENTMIQVDYIKLRIIKGAWGNSFLLWGQVIYLGFHSFNTPWFDTDCTIIVVSNVLLMLSSIHKKLFIYEDDPHFIGTMRLGLHLQTFRIYHQFCPWVRNTHRHANKHDAIPVSYTHLRAHET